MKRAKNKSNLSIVRDYLAGNRPFMTVGWVEDLTKRKEGEIWDDSSGKRWVKKNGYEKRVNKMGKIDPESARQLCSSCKRDMKWGNYLDDKMYPKTGKCYDCLIEFETALKRDGKFDTYEKVKVFKNQKGFCLDFKAKLEESINYLKNGNGNITYSNEDGSMEVWTDVPRSDLLKSAEEDYSECLAALSRIDASLKSLELES